MNQEQLILPDNLEAIPYDDTEELTELYFIHNQLRELNEMSMELGEQVSIQREQVTQVQDAVDISEMNTKQGTRLLQEAKKIGTIGTILIGSTIGGFIIGGPMGAIMGMKLGMALPMSIGGIFVGGALGGIASSTMESMSNNISGTNEKI